MMEKATTPKKNAIPEMTVDVLGRIRNTSVPQKHAFIPLFEAVVNSIQATEERFGDDVGKSGRVDVNIKRFPAEPLLSGTAGRPPVPGIAKIVVSDNGRGFTDENLKSFATADSTAKADRGGKGVGRFTWLVVFERAAIDSVVVVEDGELERRRFNFVPSPQGIEGFEAHEGAEKVGTTVTLSSVNDRYAEALRMGSDAIADRLFEHCFNYFVLGRCPKITLTDDSLDDFGPISVNNRIDDVSWEGPVPLLIGEHELGVLHVQRKASIGYKHEAHLCANHRVVESFGLTEHCDLNPDPYRSSEGESVVHQAFVSGRPLDQAVDATRTRCPRQEKQA